VLEASNDSAALRLAQRQPPGLELLTELKSTHATAHVPVIAVSARTDLLARAAEHADAVVAKPIDIEELLAKISTAQRRSCPGAYVPKSIASARLCRHAANRGGVQKRPFPRHLDPARQWQTGISNRLDTTTPTGLWQPPGSADRAQAGPWR
jgi:DNA-binding response OmpR family regulator